VSINAHFLMRKEHLGVGSGFCLRGEQVGREGVGSSAGKWGSLTTESKESPGLGGARVSWRREPRPFPLPPARVDEALR